MQSVAEHVVGTPYVLDQSPGEVFGKVLAVDTNLQDREFVAAQTPDHITSTQTGLKTPGDALQEAVAHLMTVTVVHLLEIIEVDPVQGKAEPRVVALELVLEAFAEVIAVGDLGQRV